MPSDALPILLVHLDDPQTGAVSFKPRGLKGARWRKARSIYEASTLADAVLSCPREIHFVERKS
jgi:hypothetical protein